MQHRRTIIGARGFEPATFGSQNRRSSHASITEIIERQGRLSKRKPRESRCAGVALNCGEPQRTLTPTLSRSTGRGGGRQGRHKQELHPAARWRRGAPWPWVNFLL